MSYRLNQCIYLFCTSLKQLDVNMNIKWLILLPPFLSWYMTSILSRILVIVIIATMKSNGDTESPWKIPLLILTSASLVPELVSIVFQLGIVFLRNLMVFSSAPYISRHSVSHKCGIMSKAFLQSIHGIIRLVFLPLLFIITILSISSWSLVALHFLQQPFYW